MFVMEQPTGNLMELRCAKLPLLWHWWAKMPQVSDTSLITWGREGRVAKLVCIGDDVSGKTDAWRPCAIPGNVWQGMLVR